MTPDEPTQRLSGEEIVVLRFASHRQLARWSNKFRLSPRQLAQRDALKRAVRILQDNAFSGGCELHAPKEERHADA